MNLRVMALLTALLCLSACGAENTPVTDTVGVSDTSAAVNERVENLPEADFGGENFNFFVHIIGTKIFNNEHLAFTEETGELLNDAFYKRNRTVEERFNVVITETAVTKNGKAELEKVIMAGEDEYDVAVLQNNGSLPNRDCLVPFNDLEYVDLTAPWWDANLLKDQTINGKLYFAYGSIHIAHIDPCNALFYNKKIATDYASPDFYRLVRDGKWTLDSFLSAGKGVSHDLNGDSVFDDRDMYGYTSLAQNSWVSLMISCGTSYTSIENGLPTLAINSRKFSDVFDKVTAFMTTPNFVYDPHIMTNTGTDQDSAIFRVFANNQTLFMSHGLGSINQLRDMASDFGVLPYPKLDETQEEYRTPLRSEKYFMIPKTNTDLERTGIILEALAAEGLRTLIPQYYETMLQNKYLRDEESVEMLDKYIIPGLTVVNPFGDSTIATKFKNMCDSGQYDLASFLASNLNNFQDVVAKLIEE